MVRQHGHLFVWLLCIACTFYTYGYTPEYDAQTAFQTLDKAITYANSYPEHPPGDMSHPLDPNYTEFYREHTPTLVRRTLEALGLAPTPMWTPYDCAAVLNAIESRLYTHAEQSPVLHLQAKPETKLYIWGKLHAAFHSFVRDLRYLRDQGVINNDLEIQSPHSYFVFTGNAIDLSAYSMETLTLLGTLIIKNPEQVIYLEGEHEEQHYWENFGLKRQVDIYTKSLYYNVPLQEIIDSFFKRLPHALYVTTDADSNHALYIANQGIRQQMYNLRDSEQKPSPEQRIVRFETTTTTPQKVHSDLDIVSLIRNENWLYNQRAHDGLGMLEQEQGATTWTSLSSPVYTHRTYYPFTKDAFVCVDVATSIQGSTITLFNKPYDKDVDFQRGKAYDLYTGIPYDQMQPQHRNNTFKIGSTMGIELNLRVMSEQTRRGAMARINTENAQGGLHNNTHMRMYTYNDDYQPYQAQANINYMLDHGIETILAPTGTPTLEGYIDKVKNNELLVLFPITGSPIFRKPELEGVIHFRSTYADEVEALIEYMVEDYNASSFAFVYQDDEYGKSALRPAREELKKRGISDWTEVPYVRGSASFTEQARKIREASPQVIAFFSASEPLIKIIQAIGIPWLANKHLFAITFAFTQETRYFLQESGLSMSVGAVTPNPHVSELPIAKEYREAMDARDEQYDKFSFEAYIGTSIMIDAAQQVNGPVTRNAIKKTIEGYNNYHFKGLNLTFDPKTRSLAPGVWIETVQDPQEPWKKQK